jgi:hypothetical protein
MLFPFGSCPLWVLIVKLVSPVQTHFSFFNKVGSYGLLSKKEGPGGSSVALADRVER